MKKLIRILLIAIFAVPAAIFMLLAASQVPTYNRLDPAQKKCIDTLLRDAGVGARDADPADAVKTIRLTDRLRLHIIRTVVHRSDYDPYTRDNLPCAVLRQGYGQCFNRSLLFELAMQKLGYHTRHVFLYTKFWSLGESHAMSEVLTAGRWLGVSTSRDYESFHNGNHVFSISDVMKNPTLIPSRARDAGALYTRPDTHLLYGLYSRTGRLYSPRLIVPDTRLADLHYNFSNH